jgi:hypothetical protein
MKKSVLIVLMMFAVAAVQAQYYYIAKKGVDADFNPFTSTGATTLLNKPSNDVLSTAQTIPFAWSYYGNPVTQYKASDNGYITFDVSSTTSDGANTTLPDAGGPNNAIYAFWDDLELKTFTPNANAIIAVKSWTYGTAPKRIHVIQWMAPSPFGQASASNVLYATVRLYEGGDFDVVNSYGFGSFSGTIGCENTDGTAGTMVTGSPNRNFGGGNGTYDAATSDVFEFHEGTQSMYDIAMLKSTTPAIVSVSTGATVAGVLSNYGSEAITSFTLNYTVDGGSVVTQNVTSVNIAPSGGTYNFSHATKAMLATAGKNYAIKVWASNINGNVDGNTTNDELSFSVFVNNGVSGDKHVFVEEGTGAWCGYCPDGHLRMKDIIDQIPSTVAVMHHNSDGMTNTNSDIINTTYQTGFPYGMIDRVLFSGETTVGQNRGLWANRVATQVNAPTPFDVKITTKTWDAATRKINFTVEVKSVDYAQGDIRINAYVVENNIKGAAGNSFSQHNYYSSTNPNGAAGGPSHPLYNEAYVIDGYNHQHVVRNIPSGAWGTAGVIPNTVAPNATYTQSYSYTLPAEKMVTLAGADPIRGMNKAEDIVLAAFVSYYNADVNKRQVMNSTEVTLFGGYNGISNPVKTEIATTVYPNPTSGLTTVNFTLTNTAATAVEVYDMLGNKVLTANEGQYTAGEHTVAFNADALSNGMYLVQVKIDGEIAGVSKFVVNK